MVVFFFLLRHSVYNKILIDCFPWVQSIGVNYFHLQGEDRKKWPPMKIGFLDYNCVKRAENVEKFINRTVQLPNMTEGLTLLNLKCNFHHTNR